MDIVTEVRTLLNEATGVFWPDAQIYDGINAALVEVWGNLRWKAASTTFTVSSGTDIVAFDAATIMIPQFFLYNNLKQFNTVHAQLEDWSRRWKDEPQARPKWFVLWDASRFRVFPTPDASYSFTLWGVPWPAEISGSNTDLPASVEPMVRKAIALRATAHLLELTQQLLADGLMAEAKNYEKRAGVGIRNQLGANTWRMSPGVGWEIAQYGDIRMGRKYL